MLYNILIKTIALNVIKLPLPEIILTHILDKFPVMEYNKENKIRGLIDEFCISSRNCKKMECIR